MNQGRMYARNDFSHGDHHGNHRGDYRHDYYRHGHDHGRYYGGGGGTYFYDYPDYSFSYYGAPYGYYPYSYDYGSPDYSPDYSYYSGDETSSAGTSLSDVQAALSRKGYYAGPVDGLMGPLTRQAIRDYQRDNHLSVSGNVTPGLLDRLGLL